VARDAALPAIERLLRLARELNMLRPPDHQERIARAVADTQESFRANPEAGLPARGEDALSSIWSGRWQVRATPPRRGSSGVATISSGSWISGRAPPTNPLPAHCRVHRSCSCSRARAPRETSKHDDWAIVVARIKRTLSMFLRTQRTVRAPVPARCPPGPLRTHPHVFAAK